MDFQWQKDLTAEELSRTCPRIENVNLTGAELTVALAVLKGITNDEAAESIFRTDKCVKYHLTTIFKKCKVSSRHALLAKYLPGMIVDRFIKKIAEKDERIRMLEFMIEELKKDFGKQTLPRGRA